MGLHFAAYFQALRLTSIASCAVLANLTVIFVAIGAVVIFRQKLNCRVWAAILSAFGGAIIITLGGEVSPAKAALPETCWPWPPPSA